MLHSFSLSRSRWAETSDPALRAEIHAHTGSDQATASILRSIERFGGDASIESFEVTPREKPRVRASTGSVSWSVRALRRGDPLV